MDELIRSDMGRAGVQGMPVAAIAILPSLSGGRRMVESGVSIGVFLSNGSAKLIVNRRSAQVEGLDLSADVLALAEVIR